MVEFFSPNCGYCRKLEPDYAKAAKELQDVIPFITLDCSENREVCQEYNVDGKSIFILSIVDNVEFI